jgi:hypothetical protein
MLGGLIAEPEERQTASGKSYFMYAGFRCPSSRKRLTRLGTELLSSELPRRTRLVVSVSRQGLDSS